MTNNHLSAALIAMLAAASLVAAPAWAQERGAPPAPDTESDSAQPAAGAQAGEAPVDPREQRRREREAKRQARENRRRAKELTRSSKKALAAKRFDEAIATLKEAYELDPQPERMFHLAVAHHLRSTEHEAAGQYQQAYEAAQRAYQQYQTFLAAEGRGRLAAEARQYATQLEAELQKEDLRRAREAELRQALQTAEAAQKAAKAEAQAAREQASQARQALDDYQRAAAQAEARRQSARPAAEAAGSGAGGGKRTAGTVMLVSGGLSLGAALAYGLAASRAQDDLEGADPWPEGGDPYHAFGDSAASRQLYLGIAGAVLTAGGAVVYYLGVRDARRPARLEQRDLAIVPAVGAHGAGVQVSGQF